MVINVTDVNDKIYDAAPRRGDRRRAEHAAAMTRALRRGHRRARARPARRRAAGDRDDRRDRRADRDADRAAGTPTSRAATSTSASAASSGYGKLSNRDPDEMDQGEEAGAAEPQGEPARLRAVEGAQGGRGHVLALAVGRRAAPAGTSSARRWPRRCSAPTSRSTAAAPTSSSPTTRTRSRRPRPRAACRWRGSGCTTGWSAPTRRRCRSRSATSSSSPRRSTASAREAVVAFLELGPLPPAARVLRARAGGGRRPGRADPQLPARARTRRWPEEDPFVAERREAFLDGARRRLQHPAGVRGALRADRRGQPPAAARRARGARRAARRCSGSSRCSSGAATGPTPRPRRCWPSASRPGPSATSSAPTRSATSSPSSAGRSATRPTARAWSARA